MHLRVEREKKLYFGVLMLLQERRKKMNVCCKDPKKQKGAWMCDCILVMCFLCSL